MASPCAMLTLLSVPLDIPLHLRSRFPSRWNGGDSLPQDYSISPPFELLELWPRFTNERKARKGCWWW